MSLEQELHEILASGLAAQSLQLSDDQQAKLVGFVLLIDKWN